MRYKKIYITTSFVTPKRLNSKQIVIDLQKINALKRILKNPIKTT